MNIKDTKDLLKYHFTDFEEFIPAGAVGIEKENLRACKGSISLEDHPTIIGAPLTNKYFTTDFSEAQLEIVTPPDMNKNNTLEFLRHLHEFVYKNLGSETLWCFSMPPFIESEDMIRIAEYGSSNLAQFKMIYRRGLANRYGRMMQAISGIHYNYSFSDFFLGQLGIDNKNKSHKNFISNYYFRVIRNIKRFNWLILYLFGASPVVTRNFIGDNKINFKSRSDYFYLPFSTSFRMSSAGYQNKKRGKLSISTDSLNKFINDLQHATKTESKEFIDIYHSVTESWPQINANQLQIEDEFYEIVRPKSMLAEHPRLSSNLKVSGVDYIELRSIDLNPFSPEGIDIETFEFLEALIIYSGLIASPKISDDELVEIKNNDQLVALEGRNPSLKLYRNGKEVLLRDWANEILDEIEPITTRLGVKENIMKKYSSMIHHPELTISGQVFNILFEKYNSFHEMAWDYSNKHKDYYKSLTIEENPLWKDFEEEAKNSFSKKNELENNDKRLFEEFVESYFSE